MTFGKAVKSLLSLRDPDDKVVRAILSFPYSFSFIKIPRSVF